MNCGVRFEFSDCFQLSRARARSVRGIRGRKQRIAQRYPAPGVRCACGRGHGRRCACDRHHAAGASQYRRGIFGRRRERPLACGDRLHARLRPAAAPLRAGDRSLRPARAGADRARRLRRHGVACAARAKLRRVACAAIPAGNSGGFTSRRALRVRPRPVQRQGDVRHHVDGAGGLSAGSDLHARRRPDRPFSRTLAARLRRHGPDRRGHRDLGR